MPQARAISAADSIFLLRSARRWGREAGRAAGAYTPNGRAGIARSREGFGEVQGGIWRGIGQELARFGAGIGEVLGGIWRGSGRDLARL